MFLSKRCASLGVKKKKKKKRKKSDRHTRFQSEKENASSRYNSGHPAGICEFIPFLKKKIVSSEKCLLMSMSMFPKLD